MDLELWNPLMQFVHKAFVNDLGAQQTVFKFTNGYGASVICGPYSYGGREGLFELAVLYFDEDNDWHLTYDTVITDDVLGYLSSQDVFDILLQIKDLPPAQQLLEEQ